MQFPLFKTKIEGLKRKFNLIDPKERREYFEAKCKNEILALKEYLDKGNTFIAYLLGKKNSGKGTYAKMMIEIFGQRIKHLSVGDLIREVDGELNDEKKFKELISFLEKNYRGFHSLDEIIFILKNRSTKTLLPTELMLALIEREIEKEEKKSLFIDGFPRNLDQISFSLFFRHLINRREDPDIFVLVDVPEIVIEERIKYRRVCPLCQNSRNLKLLPTPKIGFDKEKNEFYLICENDGARMEKKEGDELGLEPIRERLEMDQKLMEMALNLYGVPKILLRNSVPVEEAGKLIDDYEITPEYEYYFENGKVKVKEKPWIFKDKDGKDYYSLLAPPVVVSLICQLKKILVGP
ncbi:MAG: nucleoside monophosphate kinase [Candidatus Pacearchaeota archaeon]